MHAQYLFRQSANALHYPDFRYSKLAQTQMDFKSGGNVILANTFKAKYTEHHSIAIMACAFFSLPFWPALLFIAKCIPNRIEIKTNTAMAHHKEFPDCAPKRSHHFELLSKISRGQGALSTWCVSFPSAMSMAFHCH